MTICVAILRSCLLPDERESLIPNRRDSSRAGSCSRLYEPPSAGRRGHGLVCASLATQHRTAVQLILWIYFCFPWHRGRSCTSCRFDRVANDPEQNRFSQLCAASGAATAQQNARLTNVCASD